jgi:hypothetical protein
MPTLIPAAGGQSLPVKVTRSPTASRVLLIVAVAPGGLQMPAGPVKSGQGSVVLVVDEVVGGTQLVVVELGAEVATGR